MQLGRGFTAARQRASRLAGLVRFPAGWPIQTAIRRQASWLAQGAVPLDPGLRAAGAQGTRETCSLTAKLPPLGNGPRGSRVWCGSLLGGKFIPPFGDRPHGSLKKASVKSKSRWPFALQKYTSCIEASQLARDAYAHRQLRGDRSLRFCAARQSSSRKHVTLQGVSMPTANCGGAERR